MYCCVPFCKSNAKNKLSNVKISFHEFPVDEDICRQWLRRVARKDFVPNDKSGSSVVCSKHFTPGDYVPHSKIAKLKKNAVPTVFPMYPPYALLPPNNNSSSLAISNNGKRKYIKKNVTKRPRKVVDPALAYNYERVSTNNKSPETQKNQYDSSHLLQTLNHLKKLSTENSKTKVAECVAFESGMTFTNNNSLKQPGVVHELLTNEAKKDPTDSNRSSLFANFNNTKILSKEENATEKVGTGIVFDSDIISTDDNSSEQLVHVLTTNESKKDHPVANKTHSLVSLNHLKRSSVNVNEITNFTVQDNIGAAFNSGMTFTNNNSQQQPSVASVSTINVTKKNIPAANNSCSVIGMLYIGENSTKKDDSDMSSANRNYTEQKKKKRALTLNDSIQKSVVGKNRELRNLRSLLWKKNQKLKKMKEEIDKLEEKVSLYETNDQILRKIGSSKENSPQSDFIMDQMDNFFKKRPSWRESTVRECASWMAFSPKSYEFVRERKLMVLPCKATLLRYAYSGEIKRQKMDTCHLDSRQAESPEEMATENSVLEH